MILDTRFMKRLVLEEKEFHEHPRIVAKPLLNDSLEWHFTLCGRKGTPYENGFYHGVILLSETYPFTAPDVMLLTVI